MDFDKKAKTQTEQDQEPIKAISTQFPAGQPPTIIQSDESSEPQNYLDDLRARKIRERAYAIWLDEGQCNGRDQAHWKEAEHEIDKEQL